MKKKYKESVSEWVQRNKINVIIRHNFDRTDAREIADPVTGEIVGMFYPYGYDKVHCFIDIRAVSDPQNREKVFRAVARKFFAMNRVHSYENTLRLAKEYFRRVSAESHLGISEYEIAAAINWAEANEVDGYASLLVKSYYTFNSRNIPIHVVQRVVRHYNNERHLVRNFNLVSSSVELQKESNLLITQKSTAEYSKEVDDRGKGVSERTVKRNWVHVKEDVENHNRSNFGIDNYSEIRITKTIQKLIKAYNSGCKTKMSLHKETGISRSTIDVHWETITL